MAQYQAWEKEYKTPQFVTKFDKPQTCVLKYFKYLKKQGFEINGARVLDLGSGTGRNSNYLAKLGAEVVGFEISDTAIDLARARAKDLGVNVRYVKKDIGSKYPFDDKSFDLVLDVTSSNSLNEEQRAIYLQEVKRVLKPGGYFFVRALCLDGDKNAKHLLCNNLGPEHHTYSMPKTGIVERVFTRQEFIDTYGQYFEVAELLRQGAYTKFQGQSYKRNFWVAYLRSI